MSLPIGKYWRRLATVRAPRLNSPAAGSVVLSSVFYLLLFWQLRTAGTLGSILLAVTASVFGPFMCMWFARVVPRILSGTGDAGPALRVGMIVTVMAVALISYVAFHRIPTGSWVTGIGSMGLMGPLVCIPTALYFGGIAKRLTFLM